MATYPPRRGLLADQMTRQPAPAPLAGAAGGLPGYVVFDDGLLSIKSRNGKGLLD